MEELGREIGDEEMRSEMFICGVFSLPDRMFQQPFKELLANILVPERVFQALAEESGPFQPYVNMVRAIENESLFDFRECADALMTSVSEINRAQLRAPWRRASSNEQAAAVALRGLIRPETRLPLAAWHPLLDSSARPSCCSMPPGRSALRTRPQHGSSPAPWACRCPGSRRCRRAGRGLAAGCAARRSPCGRTPWHVLRPMAQP